jgi:MFS family permease
MCLAYIHRPKIAAVFALAWMMDKYGRKSCLVSLVSYKVEHSLTPQYFGALFMLAGALLGGFAKGIGMLCGSRVLIGLGTVSGRKSLAIGMNPRLMTRNGGCHDGPRASSPSY